MTEIRAYQHGIYPRSEGVVAATRDLERGRISPDEVEERFLADEEDLVRLQREAGLDHLSDGLLRWQDIFRPFAEASKGLAVDGLVRWFDNNAFYRAPEVTGPVGLEDGIPDVFATADRVPGSRVATLPSPYLFSRAAKTDGDRTSLMLDFAREVLRPVADGLAGDGYEVIHLQEPWLVYHGIHEDEWDAFGEALGAINEGLRARLHLHTYFGDAGRIADRLRNLPVDAIGVDVVETDLDALEAPWPIGLVLGCLDGRSSPLEPADAVASLTLRLLERLDPQDLFLSSGSDLELLPQVVAEQKVRRLGEIAATLKETAS